MTFVTKNSLRAATSLVVAATICLAPRRAHALRNYDSEITPAVILAGTAIDSDDTTAELGILENEAWVVMRKYGIELGIRGRLCYEDTNDNTYCPNNVYPTNKDGTFNFEAGAIPDVDHFCPIYYGPIEDDGGPEWCIDYSINVDYKEDDDDEAEAEYRGRGRELWSMEEEEEPRVLADYVYQLSLDADPSCATNSSTWDPINAARDGESCLDAFYMGDNDTPSGEGIEVLCDDTDTYESNITESSVAQQTLNYVLLTDPLIDGGYPVISPDPVRETFNADTTPATYSMTLKVFCRDDDYECKRENAAGGGSSSKSTGSSGNTKNSKGGKYDDHDDDDDNGKSTKSSRDDKDKYDKRYEHNRKLYSESDYHYKDDEEEGPVLIASVTVHYLIGGGEGTDTDGDGICDSQDIWGDCPDPEEECKYHEYLEINGCKTLACKDSCLIPDWVYNCEKYEHDCDDYLTCVETGANAAAENGFITREQSGSVKECACQADVCADSDKSKSKTSKGGQYYSNKKEGDHRRRRKSKKKGRRLNEPDAFEFESPTDKLMPDSLLIKASGTGGKRTARRQRKTPGGILP